jgi:hypothetical protein
MDGSEFEGHQMAERSNKGNVSSALIIDFPFFFRLLLGSFFSFRLPLQMEIDLHLSCIKHSSLQTSTDWGFSCYALLFLANQHSVRGKSWSAQLSPEKKAFSE